MYKIIIVLYACYMLPVKFLKTYATIEAFWFKFWKNSEYKMTTFI